MTITYHRDLIQGSDEWHAARCGMLTASEVKLILTPTLKAASNDKERSHLWELAAQRINKYVEPSYIGEAMLRGHEDEIEARALYDKYYAPVEDCGFITNDEWGFTLGCSPDGLVGDEGLIECKSRCQKYQMQTIIEGTVPTEYVLQVQTALLVSGRSWLDFLSYCGGMPMFKLRVFSDDATQRAIVDAAAAFEARLADAMRRYETQLAANRYIPTERRIIQEMFVS